jgi:hypothetical protein
MIGQEFINAWKEFVQSVRSILTPSSDERELDQFLPLRNHVLEVVQSEDFLTQFKNEFEKNITTNDKENSLNVKIIRALIMEMQAFPLSVEVAEKNSKLSNEANWNKKSLGRASTVTGSIKDFVKEDTWVKKGLIVFNEVIDIFK